MKNIPQLFIQNVVWRGLFYITSFTLNLAIARHFEAGASGVIYYLITSYAFITLLLSISFESAIVYFTSNEEIKKSKLFGLSIIWLISSGVLLLLFFGFIKYTYPESVYAKHGTHGVLFICGNLLTAFMSGFFYAHKNFKFSNIIGIVINALLILLIVLVNEKGVLNNNIYLNVYFGSYLLQGAILAIALIKSSNIFREDLFPTKVELKKIFNYLLIVFTCNIITFLCYRIDYWFVHYFCTPKELGNYIQVSKLVQMFFVFPSILAAVVFPLTAGGNKKQIKDLLGMVSRLILITYAVLCLLLTITGKWLFPFMFGDSFTEMYSSFLFYIPGIICFSSLYILSAYYSGKGKAIVNMKGGLIAMTTIIVGDALLIPRFGIKAAAGVSSVGYLLYFLYVLRIFMKEYDVTIKQFFYLHFEDLNKIKKIIFRDN